jgi:hypothetical protein
MCWPHRRSSRTVSHRVAMRSRPMANPVKIPAPSSRNTTTARLRAYGRDERPWGSDAPPANWYRSPPIGRANTRRITCQAIAAGCMPTATPGSRTSTCPVTPEQNRLCPRRPGISHCQACHPARRAALSCREGGAGIATGLTCRDPLSKYFADSKQVGKLPPRPCFSSLQRAD